MHGNAWTTKKSDDSPCANILVQPRTRPETTEKHPARLEDTMLLADISIQAQVDLRRNLTGSHVLFLK